MNNRGFTLIEIMVALLVFSLIFLPLTAVLVAESKFERVYERKQVAMTIAKNEIEKAKRTFRQLSDEEYQTAMAGKLWSVERTVRRGEAAVLADSAKVPIDTILLRVRAESDTTVLAEFQVLKETYR